MLRRNFESNNTLVSIIQRFKFSALLASGQCDLQCRIPLGVSHRHIELKLCARKENSTIVRVLSPYRFLALSGFQTLPRIRAKFCPNNRLGSTSELLAP